MSAGAFAGKGGALRAAVLGAAMLLAAGADAKSTGVGNDPTIQSGPCYEALVDKNAATPTTAPNRELGAACEAEHGDVNMAWARVIRLWGSDSAVVPDYDSYRAADAPVDGVAPPDGLVRFTVSRGSGTLWVVVRDGRGGESWLAISWTAS